MSVHIVVVDDVEKHLTEVVRALGSLLGEKGKTTGFSPGIGGLDSGMYEDRLKADFKKGVNRGATLVVADRDLSAESKYGGLSEATVRRVADELGIPECGYARGEPGGDKEYVQRGGNRESCIRLSLKPSLDNFAKQVLAIEKGFADLSEGIKKHKKVRHVTAGVLLATVLGKPEYADKLSLYATGDRNRLQAVLALKTNLGNEPPRQRLACLLGYWLWDSVLRFPGVVVDPVAASSYLDIEQGEFEKRKEIQSLFKAALYAGPFADAKPTLWWRGQLDDIVRSRGFETGNEYVRSKLRKQVAKSRCCEDSKKSAGHVCFLSGRPVSIENSRPGLSWFPRGADLARVSKSKLAELGPWL